MLQRPPLMTAFEKLEGVYVSVYGVRIGIRTNRPGILEHLVNCVAPGWKYIRSADVDRMYFLVVTEPGLGSSQSPYRLYADHQMVDQCDDLERAVLSFESDLDAFVAVNSPKRIFVHAGVVSWKGRAIVIPGRSHSGKTTLVSELIRAGAQYYSDESAVFDLRGRVYPFLKPLFIRDRDGTRRKHSPEALGATGGRRARPVGLVVVTRYRPGARWRPRLLSPGQAVLALLSHTPCARERPGLAIRTFAEVASTAHILKGTRGEADAVAQDLLRRASK